MVLSADVPLKELFTAAKDMDVDDDKRALMDDLKLTNESVRCWGLRLQGKGMMVGLLAVME